MTTTTTAPPAAAQHRDAIAPIALNRIVQVELRKMFDTRSGFWLMSSIVIVALITMVATILFAPDADMTYYTFARAIGFPMTVVLPMVAILAITGEWSQRTGLATFTMVPHRSRVLVAKTVSSVVVGVSAMLFAFLVGTIGNLVGTAVAGTDAVWDVSVAEGANIVLGSMLCLLTGTMLGMLVRSSPGALVSYFVVTLLLPTVASILATSEKAFAEVQPWVDANYARSFLFEGTLTGEQWAHVAVTSAVWLVAPALLGLRLVLRSEVK